MFNNYNSQRASREVRGERRDKAKEERKSVESRWREKEGERERERERKGRMAMGGKRNRMFRTKRSGQQRGCAKRVVKVREGRGKR